MGRSSVPPLAICSNGRFGLGSKSKTTTWSSLGFGSRPVVGTRSPTAFEGCSGYSINAARPWPQDS